MTSIATRSGSSRRTPALLVAAVGTGVCAAAGVVHAGSGITPWLLLLLGGLLCGFLSGLLGIGGALVSVPTFYAVLPMFGARAPDLAGQVVASALLAMVPTALAAARRGWHLGALDRTWLLRLSLPMAVGSVAGALIAAHAPGVWLGWLFAMQSLYYGGRLVLDRHDGGGASPRGLTRSLCQAPAWLLGSVMAAFSSAVGMGSGSMVAPFLRHRGLDLRRAVATTGFLNLWIAFGGTAVFLLGAASESIAVGPNVPAALALGVVAALVAPAGVSAAHATPATRLRLLIGAVYLVGATCLICQLVGR
jgi:uncharacterized membrane protein YfcA